MSGASPATSDRVRGRDWRARLRALVLECGTDVTWSGFDAGTAGAAKVSRAAGVEGRAAVRLLVTMLVLTACTHGSEESSIPVDGRFRRPAVDLVRGVVQRACRW